MMNSLRLSHKAVRTWFLIFLTFSFLLKIVPSLHQFRHTIHSFLVAQHIFQMSTVKAMYPRTEKLLKLNILLYLTNISGEVALHSCRIRKYECFYIVLYYFIYILGGGM